MISILSYLGKEINPVEKIMLVIVFEIIFYRSVNQCNHFKDKQKVICHHQTKAQYTDQGKYNNTDITGDVSQTTDKYTSQRQDKHEDTTQCGQDGHKEPTKVTQQAENHTDQTIQMDHDAHEWTKDRISMAQPTQQSTSNAPDVGPTTKDSQEEDGKGS